MKSFRRTLRRRQLSRRVARLIAAYNVERREPLALRRTRIS